MQVLIIKDSATQIPREVADMAEVVALRQQGFEVEVPEEAPAAEESAVAAPAAKKTAAKKTAG